MVGRTDPLQQALSSKRTHSFYSIPATHSHFFKTQKYDFEHFGMSFTQRVMAFAICFGLGILLMLYSLMRIPLAVLYPMSFAVPYALSNLMFFFMFGFLSGFKSYFKNLFSKNKRAYTVFFMLSTIITLYSAMFNTMKILKFPLMLIQIVSFICFAITFLPGGATGISSLIGVVLKK